MNKSSTKLFTAITMLGAAALLTACGSAPESSSTWVKSESPWGKRTAAVTDSAAEPAPASASETYRRELDDDLEIGSTSGYAMEYKPESVKSVVPAEPIMEESAPPPPEPQPAPVKKATPAPAPLAAVAKSSSSAGDDDFKNVAPAYFTLQVIASVDKKAIYKFAQEHQLSTRYVVPTVRGSTTWHVLLLDVYPNKAAAKAALDDAASNLPTKPWIRTVASVQSLMP